MDALDRKIAELKGLDFFDPGMKRSIGIVRHDIQRIGGGPMRVVETGWAGSDSKALELVDELAAHDDVCGFDLFLVATVPKRIWKAEFAVHGEPRRIGCVEESRPEAICRAYIAAREWMAGRGKG